MTTKLLRLPEVARILDVNEDCAYKMAREGIIPVVRIGRQIRVDQSSLDQWIASGGQALPGGWRREAVGKAN
jgi:excisionase family DNA binding protein